MAECSLLCRQPAAEIPVWKPDAETADGGQWLDNSADNGGKPWARIAEYGHFYGT
ncbi:MAG: hypothetical protein ACLUSL_11905 [Ruminococcus sp.]